MRSRRSLTAAFAVAALVALGGAAFAGPLSETVGADVAFGGFDYSGGTAESGETELTFAGTEFAVTPTDTGAVVLPGFVFGALCFDDGDGLTSLREETAGTNPCVFDTDGDGLRDGGDVEFIQTALAVLPPEAFRDRSLRGTRYATSTILDDIETRLLAGDVRTAIQKLENLRLRVDGCASPSGAPDTNDWIVTCAEQLPLRADLDLLTANVRP